MSEKRMPMPGGPGGPGRPGMPGRGGPMAGRMMAEKPKDAKKTLLRMLKYLGSFRLLMFSLWGIMLLAAVAELAGPALQGAAIDCISLGESGLSVDFEGLAAVLAAMLGVYLCVALLHFLQSWIAATLSQKCVRKIRGELFAKLSRLPIRYFDTHRHGDIMSRVTNDAENISNGLSNSVTQLFSGVITLVGALVMMLIYSPLLTLVAMVTIPLTLLASGKVVKFARKYYRRQQRLLGDLNGQIEENVTGFKSVTAYNRQAFVQEEFSRTTAELKKTGIMAQIFGGIMGPLMNVIGNLNYLLVAAAGGLLALRGNISVGAIQAFLQYSKQFTRPINMIANQYTVIQSSIAGAERIFEILDTESEVDAGCEAFADLRGELSFRNVNFSYVPEKPILRDFSLEIKPGEKIAFVGATGAGKTTVANLITRFYDIQSGEIYIDGVEIRDIRKHDLRDSIGMVLQDTVLFSGTIAENIRYGREDATDEEMYAAARTANADRFIRRLPEGYNTPLAEAAENLSQGQRQLIAIARAALKDPKILILDEATSSIDTRTEMHIQSAMISLMKNRTSIIIAHRLSTIRDADRIVVMSDGRIAETGSHEELLAKGGIYYNLYKNQFEGYAT
ncbi:MAG: ABC transporter ATP-binding protein [Clostridia bacterium]|nr:ABC transporter ATP-binding protein [Clostridia bacterium]